MDVWLMDGGNIPIILLALDINMRRMFLPHKIICPLIKGCHASLKFLEYPQNQKLSSQIVKGS